MILPLALQPRVHAWTCAEFNRVAQSGAFDGLAIELIEGTVIDMCPMGSPHGAIVSHLDRILNRLYHEATGLCVRCQLPLALDSDSQPQPDIAVVPGSPLDYFQRAPDEATLVIEVAESSLAFDRGLKAEHYAAAKVQEYWIINLIDEQLEVYRRQPNQPGFAAAIVLQRGEQVNLPGLPDVALAVSELLP